MGRRKAGGIKEKRRKRVTVRLVPEKHAGQITEPYRILAEIRKKDHAHLEEAKIGLAWRIGWKADTDKHLKLGQCRKRGDLDRELDSFDFIIMLNDEAWPSLNDAQKRALIDHELCHAALSLDSDGSQKYNDRDRLVCRIKKHDVEEFRCIVDRHGLWTQDLEEIAKAAINDAKRPLLEDGKNGKAEKGEKNGEPVSGPVNVKDWRGWNLERLSRFALGECGLPPGKVKLLESAGLSTLGKLMDAMNKSGQEDFWWRDIRGFGESGYDALTTAIVKLRKQEPAFQAE